MSRIWNINFLIEDIYVLIFLAKFNKYDYD